MKLSRCMACAGLAMALAPSLFGQGSLTPPGAPAPTMKTLDQVEPRRPIAAVPFSITSGGSYYVTTNLLGVAGQNGISISADNVTLDLGGWTVQGVTNSNNGIVLTANLRNIVIRNGAVRGWGLHGINASTGGGQFEGVLASENGQSGISAGAGSLITRCSATANGGPGLSALEGSGVKDCIANQNNVGINLAERCTVLGSTAVGNSGHGIYPSAQCMLRGCTVSANGGWGINANFAGCSVYDCSVTTNSAGGISAGIGSTVKGCSVAGNSGSGIAITSRCAVTENVCDGNGNGGTLAGIHASGNGNRIEGNSLTSNNSRGLRVDGTGNLVVKNSARGSAVNFAIAAGNVDARVVALGTGFVSYEAWANFELP